MIVNLNRYSMLLIDVAKHNHSAMIVNFLGDIIIPKFDFPYNNHGIDFLKNKLQSACSMTQAKKIFLPPVGDDDADSRAGLRGERAHGNRHGKGPRTDPEVHLPPARSLGQLPEIGPEGGEIPRGNVFKDRGSRDQVRVDPDLEPNRAFA
jgi:hypothetical protein